MVKSYYRQNSQQERRQTRNGNAVVHQFEHTCANDRQQDARLHEMNFHSAEIMYKRMAQHACLC